MPSNTPAVAMTAMLLLSRGSVRAASSSGVGPIRRTAPAFIAHPPRAPSPPHPHAASLAPPAPERAPPAPSPRTRPGRPGASAFPPPPTGEPFRVNLLTLPLEELEALLRSWGMPAYRARQIHAKIFSQGVTDIDEMTDLPKKLRAVLKERATVGSLHLEVEQVSKDGTRKRAYKLHDGQVIESVLMPYDDGRRTACISSQAGCAMGCVFCATGQMGFARQLTAEEIYEQVARFASELRGRGERLSNVVMMGMGEPLMNYRNVVAAIRRMNDELGIGARKITVSTVGIVPAIKKLMDEDLQVRLALSLHCATDEERTALLPANRRYGGLDELMSAIQEYVRVKRQRVTFEWALIEGENDTPEVARTLGRLLRRHGIRSDMAHVNLIPLNPTGGYGGGPSGRANARRFVEVLESEFGVSATPRMRRGIDIDAGCGQLTTTVKKKEAAREVTVPAAGGLPVVGIYEDEEDERTTSTAERSRLPLLETHAEEEEAIKDKHVTNLAHGSRVDFSIDNNVVNLDDDVEARDFIDPQFEDEFELDEAARLIALVEGTSLVSAPTTQSPEAERQLRETSREPISESLAMTDEEAIRKAKRRRKKLLKQLKAIQKLKDMETAGKKLNQEQRHKVSREEEWTVELESLEQHLL